jgi:predicted CXXCH cytochrome family protein
MGSKTFAEADGLTKSHPVGITYDETTGNNNADLIAQGTAESNLGLSAGDLNKVSCVSCHNPHEGTNAKMTRQGTGLCLDCHNK